MDKKGQGLPVNIVVMMIIGIVIFGIGFSIFAQFSSSSDKRISDLNNKIENDIANAQCNSNEWICSPSYKLNSGDSKQFSVFLVNNDDIAKDFQINISTVAIDGEMGITKSCGSVLVYYPDTSITIKSGGSAKFPFEIVATRVNKLPCNFITKASIITTGNGDGEDTSIIVRVE